MQSFPPIGPSRRALIGATLAAALPHGLAQAQAVRPATPRQTEGPYYPLDWAGDSDADLVVDQGEAARAQGEIVHLHGRVLTADLQPISGARVEIWQCDAKGVYRHPRDERGDRRRDAGFQGRGRNATDPEGRYAFRTIRPVAYPGRTPHIHFRIDLPDRRQLITQMYVDGEPLNARDGVLASIRDAKQRASVIVRLEPADRQEIGARLGIFDIVMT